MPRSLTKQISKYEEDQESDDMDTIIQENDEEIIVNTEHDAVVVVCTEGSGTEEKEEMENVVEFCNPAMADHGYVAYPPWITVKPSSPVDTEVVVSPDFNSISLSHQELQIEEVSTVITCSDKGQIDEEIAVESEKTNTISIPENVDTNLTKSRLRVSTRKRRAIEGFIIYPEKKSTRSRIKKNPKAKKPRIVKSSTNAAEEILETVEEAVERVHLENNVAENSAVLKTVLLEEKEDYPVSNRHFIRWSRKGNKTIKQWECGKCSTIFNNQYTLLKHLGTHSEDAKYFCDICGKTFCQANTLLRHKSSHSDVREFLCQFCGKGFNRASTLISHKRIHSKEKTHICDVCGKGFHQKGNLKNHLFTHTDERPYKCDKCDRGFNQMSNLMCHKAHSHTNKPTFKCHICNEEFSRKLSLRAHEECVHNSNRKTNENGEVAEQTSKWGRPSNNARTITLPNGDKTINFNEGVKEELLQKLLNKKKRMAEKKELSEKSKPPKFNGILIPRIEADGVLEAEERGQPVFASLKPTEGIPVLVKVMVAENNMHVLVPATAQELKAAGKITVSNAENQSMIGSVKAVQVKVPVVATIIQKITGDGDMYLEIVPHAPQKGIAEDAVDSAEEPQEMPSEQITVLSL